MKLHPREQRVKRAEGMLRDALGDLAKDFDLTRGEEIRVVTSVLGGYLGLIAKYMIREERHPDDPDKPGGFE